MSKPLMKVCGGCQGTGYVSPSGIGPSRRGGPAKLICKRCKGRGKVEAKR